MVLIAIAWMYVVLMVAVVEATGSQGTLLGAAFTLVFYGLLPLAILLYLMLSPARRRARRIAEMAPDRQGPSAPGLDPDDGGHPPGDPVAAEREKP